MGRWHVYITFLYHLNFYEMWLPNIASLMRPHVFWKLQNDENVLICYISLGLVVPSHKCVKTSDVYLKQTSGIVRPLRSVSSTVTALCINFLTRYWLYTLKYSHLTSVKNLLIKLPSQDYSTPCAFSSHNSKYHI